MARNGDVPDLWKRSRGRASLRMANVTLRWAPIPTALLNPPAFCLPTLGIRGRESAAVNEGLGRSDGLNRCQGLSTAIYLALQPDLLESVPNICAHSIQQGTYITEQKASYEAEIDRITKYNW